MLTIKSFLFSFISVISIYSNEVKIAPVTHATDTYVYICESKTAYAYHSKKDCVGLDNCTHKIIRVTLDDAENYYKRKPCKKCE